MLMLAGSAEPAGQRPDKSFGGPRAGTISNLTVGSIESDPAGTRNHLRRSRGRSRTITSGKLLTCAHWPRNRDNGVDHGGLMEQAEEHEQFANEVRGPE